MLVCLISTWLSDVIHSQKSVLMQAWSHLMLMINTDVQIKNWPGTSPESQVALNFTLSHQWDQKRKWKNTTTMVDSVAFPVNTRKSRRSYKKVFSWELQPSFAKYQDIQVKLMFHIQTFLHLIWTEPKHCISLDVCPSRTLMHKNSFVSETVKTQTHLIQNHKCHH